MLNASKTTLTFIRSDINAPRMCTNLGYKWVTDFRLLGYFLHNNLANVVFNFDRPFEEICKQVEIWKSRVFTPLARLHVLKVLLLSKYTHLALMIPNPSDDQIKRLNNLFMEFIWGGKTLLCNSAISDWVRYS